MIHYVIEVRREVPPRTSMTTPLQSDDPQRISPFNMWLASQAACFRVGSAAGFFACGPVWIKI